MARLTAKTYDSVRSWGPGYNDGPDYYTSPTWYHNRGMKIFNLNNDNDLFLPDNSEAERNAVYRVGGNGSRETGNWVDSSGRLRRDQVAVGNYCWNGPPNEAQPTPPSCPSGWTDGGVCATGAAMQDYGNGPKTYRTPYDGTVPVANWATTYGEQLDCRFGATRNSVYMCQSLAQGYFWLCSSSYPYQWIVVRICYKS